MGEATANGAARRAIARMSGTWHRFEAAAREANERLQARTRAQEVIIRARARAQEAGRDTSKGKGKGGNLRFAPYVPSVSPEQSNTFAQLAATQPNPFAQQAATPTNPFALQAAAPTTPFALQAAAPPNPFAQQAAAQPNPFAQQAATPTNPFAQQAAAPPPDPFTQQAAAPPPSPFEVITSEEEDADEALPGRARAGKGSKGGTWDVQLSKALSSVLRHRAWKLNVGLRDDGYCSAEAVLALPRFRAKGYSMAQLQQVVEHNDKQRFQICEEDGVVLVRAVNGHSMQQVPDTALLQELHATGSDLPEACVHGTYRRHVQQILARGLVPGGDTSDRKHLHFAPFEPGDSRVISGMRPDCDVGIYVDLHAALVAGIRFFKSHNHIILCPSTVPARFISEVKFFTTGFRRKGSGLSAERG